MWPTTQKTLDKLRIVKPVLIVAQPIHWHAWEWRPNVDANKTVMMTCPNCCCCGIYLISRIFTVSSCSWCLTSRTYDGRSTDVCHPMEYLQSPRSENILWRNKQNPTETLHHYCLFEACGRWRHVFATTRSANHRWVPKKNVAVSPSSTTVDAGHSYDISRVLVAWLIRAGGNPPLTNTARTIYTFWYHILPHEL